MKNRTKNYYREMRAKHITRKKRIVREQHNYWHYEYEGQYSKGKIHCSCPLCRHKSYDEQKISDKRKIDNIKYLSDLKGY